MLYIEVVTRQKHRGKNSTARALRFRSITPPRPTNHQTSLFSFEQEGPPKCPRTFTLSLTLIGREKYGWNSFLKIKTYSPSEHKFFLCVFVVKRLLHAELFSKDSRQMWTQRIANRTEQVWVEKKR
jgi:hypothetical protein